MICSQLRTQLCFLIWPLLPSRSWMSSLGDELYVQLLLLFMGSFSPTDLVPLAKADALRFVDPATGAVHHARSTLQKPIYLPPKATQVRGQCHLLRLSIRAVSGELCPRRSQSLSANQI